MSKVLLFVTQSLLMKACQAVGQVHNQRPISLGLWQVGRATCFPVLGWRSGRGIRSPELAWGAVWPEKATKGEIMSLFR